MKKKSFQNRNIQHGQYRSVAERGPMNQERTRLIPGQGYILGFWAQCPVRGGQEAAL